MITLAPLNVIKFDDRMLFSFEFNQIIQLEPKKCR